MKRISSTLIIMAMFVLAIGVVSADTTIIAGKIYNSDYTSIIAGANVEVQCGETLEGYKTTTSDVDGAYKIQYDIICNSGDTLTVYGEKDGLSGFKTATLKESGDCTAEDNCLINIYDNLDVAVVNVPLVPEFTGIIASLTIMGALGAFLVVRRK